MDWRNRLLLVGAPLLIAGTASFEGLKLVDYWDKLPAKPVATSCYGHTATAKVGTRRDVTECNALLRVDMTTIYGPAVLAAVKVPITQGQLDALTDFAYNLGVTKFRNSTLLAKLNAGDYAGASHEFDKWVYVAGKDCRIAANKCGGIPKRRAWEKARFLSKD